MKSLNKLELQWLNSVKRGKGVLFIDAQAYYGTKRGIALGSLVMNKYLKISQLFNNGAILLELTKKGKEILKNE